jgi:serine phosphatase RsbU (regulator of sigma subunit)
MLRAIAWAVDDVPSHNVARLDRAMDDLEVDGMATLVYARIEQQPDGARTLRWTNAGHPPPLLIGADGVPRLLEEGIPDLMVGIHPEAERTDNRTTIAPDSMLLLYTDGLVERRGETITDGIERLRDAAARHAGKAVEAFLDAVLAELVPGRLEDDVAVLAVKFVQ